MVTHLAGYYEELVVLALFNNPKNTGRNYDIRSCIDGFNKYKKTMNDLQSLVNYNIQN